MTYALSQEEFLQASIGDPRYHRTCKALFTCDSPLESTAGTEGLLDGNTANARQLLQEAGYDGTPIVVLQAVAHERAGCARSNEVGDGAISCSSPRRR